MVETQYSGASCRWQALRALTGACAIAAGLVALPVHAGLEFTPPVAAGDKATARERAADNTAETGGSIISIREVSPPEQLIESGTGAETKNSAAKTDTAPPATTTTSTTTSGTTSSATSTTTSTTTASDPEPVQRMSATELAGARSVTTGSEGRSDQGFEELKLRWERSFGGARPDVFRGVTSRRTDMATIAVGHTMSESSGRKDAWVVAIDEQGDEIWHRAIGGAQNDAAADVVDFADGSVVIVGDTASGTGGMIAGLVAKLDRTGQVLWQQRIRGEQDISLLAVAAVAGDRVLVAGSAGPRGYIAELSSSGTMVWERFLEEGPDKVTAVAVRPNGQIVVVGGLTEIFDTDAAVAVLSSSGAILWSQTHGEQDFDTFHDVVVLLDGSILAVGETFTSDANEQGWLVGIEQDKSQTWSKLYGGAGQERLTGITMLSDQTLALVGHSDIGNAAAANSWILRVTDQGQLIKARVLGKEYADGLAEIAARPDGSFATVGFHTNGYDASRNAYVAIVGMPNRMREDQILAPRSADNPPTLFVPGGGELLTDRASIEIVGNVIHSRPIKQLYVDGKPTRILPNGAFVKHVSVPFGKTTVTVEAVDDRNVVGSTQVSVIRAEGAVQPPPIDELIEKISFGDYYAVVIGNDEYQGDLPKLRTATKDARTVANLLQKEYDFEVDLLINASRSEIVESLHRKKQLVGPDDNLLVYYAGHGYYDEDSDAGYWLPVDAELSNQSQWISNSEIRESIKGMDAKHVLLVADSCFSGTLLRNVDVQRSGKFYEQMAARSARLVMTSGGVEPVMDGGGDGHSVFARNFIRRLSSQDQIIDGTSLFQAIREPVVLTSDQVPQYSNIRFIDSDGGDFLFVRKSARR